MHIFGRTQRSCIAALAAFVFLGCKADESRASVVVYHSNNLTGLENSWPGQSLNPSVTALPGVRGSGLINPNLSIFGLFFGSEASTSTTLSLSNNDYIRFGFSVNSSATTQFDLARFRGFTSGLTSLSQGMQCQLWAVYPDTSQPPVLLSAPIAVSANTTPTTIDVAISPGTVVISPGESLELRMYFWHAAFTGNFLAFGPDPALGINPDVIIDANEIPTPAAPVVVASGLIASSRRRRLGTFVR